MQREEELQRFMAMAEEDEMNPELQRKIEDIINQKNIQENYENAMEHAPEVRTSVITMHNPMSDPRSSPG